jgi:hypothetical protein
VGGQAYRGFAELGTGSATPLGAGTSFTVSQAAAFIASHVDGMDGGDIEVEPDVVSQRGLTHGYREAAKVLHPDNGGDAALFSRLQDAYGVLMRHSRGLA